MSSADPSPAEPAAGAPVSMPVSAQPAATERAPLPSSCQVSDVLDALGLRDRIVGGDIAPLQPGLRACGSAATVQFAPWEADSDSPYDDAIAFLDGLRPGEVVVIASGWPRRSAFWGELFSAAAVGRRVNGVVSDGPLRDVPKILGLGFPAFGSGRSPGDFRGRSRIVAMRKPVLIGGVVVEPGDTVLADDDGVVAVPAAHAAQVMAAAAAKAALETSVRAELLGGATMRAVWDRHRVL